MAANNPVLLSGIQPSGDLGIGHYLGAIKHWLRLQDQHHCIFSVVDLHAITVKQSPSDLRRRSYDLLAWYIACGLDPEKNIMFLQSHVAEHCQLNWLLNCYTYMGELNRMTQFKDKAQQFDANVNVGLFAYPVLMAADILLYQTTKVPVGDDQKQHLELVRDIALRFNNTYGDIFTIPEPVIANKCSRIMSLQDPSKKMSKSDPNQNAALYMLDSAELLNKKIKRAVTDSEAVVAYDESRPGIKNLVEIYHVLSDLSFTDITERYQGQGYGVFKNDLAELVIAEIIPIQQRYLALRQDHSYLDKVFKAGAEQAKAIAAKTLAKVTTSLGLVG